MFLGFSGFSKAFLGFLSFFLGFSMEFLWIFQRFLLWFYSMVFSICFVLLGFSQHVFFVFSGFSRVSRVSNVFLLFTNVFHRLFHVAALRLWYLLLLHFGCHWRQAELT